MEIHSFFWAVFIAIVVIVFAIDFVVANKQTGTVKIKTALLWTWIWIVTGLAFGALIHYMLPDGNEKSLDYIMGYLTEKSLSVDNLFVFIIIFTSMGVEEKNRPRLLKLGIMLSIFLRILFIFAGTALLEKYHFVIDIFGVILFYTAIKMALSKEDDKIDPEKNVFYKIASKLFRIDNDPFHHRFFIVKNKKIYITHMFLVFLVIGTTDVIFAFDSLPAIFGITKDPFVVITSNVFAVLGLSSLYFALQGIMGLFRYLKSGVIVILFFISIKMLISGWYEIPKLISLLVIVLALTVSILLSVIIKEKPKK
jgi:tellurite resistance protein TerC